MIWPRALIFDVDGTLAETECAHLAAFNAAFEQFGLSWHWDRGLYEELLKVTGSIERMRYFSNLQASGPAPPGGWDAILPALHDIKNARYREALRNGEVVARPGVARLMRDAREQGIRLAIASTAGLENIRQLLTAILGDASLHWFDAVAAGDMVAQKKPAPDLYRLAVRRLGLDADQCLAIEDSAVGLQSAHAAGIRTLITASEFTRDQDFGEAVLAVDGLGEPDRACRVLRGRLAGSGYVTVDTLRSLIAPV